MACQRAAAHAALLMGQRADFRRKNRSLSMVLWPLALAFLQLVTSLAPGGLVLCVHQDGQVCVELQWSRCCIKAGNGKSDSCCLSEEPSSGGENALNAPVMPCEDFPILVCGLQDAGAAGGKWIDSRLQSLDLFSWQGGLESGAPAISRIPAPASCGPPGSTPLSFLATIILRC